MARLAAVTRIGTLLRLPVFVHFSVPLVYVLMLAFHSYALVEALGWIVGSLVVILAHELGHATMAAHLGVHSDHLSRRFRAATA